MYLPHLREDHQDKDPANAKQRQTRRSVAHINMIMKSFAYLLFSITLSIDTAWGFTSSLTGGTATALQRNTRMPHAHPAVTQSTVLVFSEVSGGDSSEAGVAEADESEVPANGPAKKRHTIFIGNLPFGKRMLWLNE